MQSNHSHKMYNENSHDARYIDTIDTSVRTAVQKAQGKGTLASWGSERASLGRPRTANIIITPDSNCFYLAI